MSKRTSNTTTRADLASAVHRANGLSQRESAELVEMVVQEIAAVLEQGESVKLTGFGSFVVRSKGARIGRNPKTRVEVPIAPRRVLRFTPSGAMKGLVNGGGAVR